MNKKNSMNKKKRPGVNKPSSQLIIFKELQIDYINEITIAETLGKDVNYLLTIASSYLLFPFINRTISSMCLALHQNYGHIIKHIWVYDFGQFNDCHELSSESYLSSPFYTTLIRLGIQYFSVLSVETIIINLSLSKLFPRGIINNLNKSLKQDFPNDSEQLRELNNKLEQWNTKLRKGTTITNGIYSFFCGISLAGMALALSDMMGDDLFTHLDMALFTFLVVCLPQWLAVASPILVHRWFLYRIKDKAFHIQKRNKEQQANLENFISGLKLDRICTPVLKGNPFELNSYFIVQFKFKKNEQDILTDIVYALEQPLGMSILDTSFNAIYVDSGVTVTNEQVQEGINLFKARQLYRKNEVKNLTDKLEQLNLLSKPLNSSEWFSQEININEMPTLRFCNFFYIEVERNLILECLKSLYGKKFVQEAAHLVQVGGTECVGIDDLIKQQEILTQYVHNTIHQELPCNDPKVSDSDIPTSSSTNVKIKEWLPQWSWINTTMNLFNWSKKESKEQSVRWDNKKYNDYITAHPTRFKRLTILDKDTEKPTNIYALFMREKLKRQAETSAVRAFFEIFKRHTFLGAGATPNLEGFKFDDKGNLEIKKKGWMGAFRPKGPLVSSNSANIDAEDSNHYESMLYAICRFPKTH